MKVFEVIGMVVSAMVVVVLVALLVLMPLDAGYWATARFGRPWGRDAVIVRQDANAKPLFICADGTDVRPLNCLDVSTLVKLARAHGVAMNHEPTPR